MRAMFFAKFSISALAWLVAAGAGAGATGFGSGAGVPVGCAGE
jgi:hypothetical protein